VSSLFRVRLLIAQLRQVFDRVPISDDVISSLRDAFNSLDSDGDGHVSRADILSLVSTRRDLFGPASPAAAGNAPLDLADPTQRGGLSKQTQRFLEQLDLLDKDDSISWEPFLFSVAASFHAEPQRKRWWPLKMNGTNANAKATGAEECC